MLLLASDLVKGSNYWPQQVFYAQHSRTSNPFKTAAATTNSEQRSQSAFRRFIIGQYSLPPNIIKITELVAVKVPYAQLIPVPHNVPYPFAVPISKPFPVEVPQLLNFNQDTPIDSPEAIRNLPHAYGEPTRTINEVEIKSPTTHGKYQNPVSQISQQLLPPI